MTSKMVSEPQNDRALKLLIYSIIILTDLIEMYDNYGQEMPAQGDETDGVNALNLQWVMGFNKDIDQGVHNLTTD